NWQKKTRWIFRPRHRSSTFRRQFPDGSAEHFQGALLSILIVGGERPAVTPFRFGSVKRGVGFELQPLYRHATSEEGRDADAGADLYAVAVNLEWDRERLDDAARNRGRIVEIFQRNENNRELVAPKARSQI